MSIQRTAADYIALAANWQAQADEEAGKTSANGWTWRELYAAEQRRAHCEQKRDVCLDAARKGA